MAGVFVFYGEVTKTRYTPQCVVARVVGNFVNRKELYISNEYDE